VHALPNLLTALRGALLPPVLWLLAGQLTPAAARWTLALFGFAVATDAADGWLARRLNSTTAIGTFFDPLIDKITANLLLVLLAIRAPHWVNVWLVLLLLAREFAVQGFRSMAPCKGVLLRTRRLNKLKFVLQSTAIAAVIAGHAWPASATAFLLICRCTLAGAVLTGYLSMIRMLYMNRDLWKRADVPLDPR
jgi:CDP-diacylglycerol--glycerol-3-phosphate 3-phosphatidyltransferase